MILKTLLEQNKDTNIKVGAKANFFYCGGNNESANKHLEQYLDREVIYCIKGVSPDEPNTMVIKVQGMEKGKFWTIREFKQYPFKTKIKYLKNKIKALRLKFKETQNVEFKEKIKQTKQKINDLTLQMNQIV